MVTGHQRGRGVGSVSAPSPIHVDVLDEMLNAGEIADYDLRESTLDEFGNRSVKVWIPAVDR